MRRSHQRSLLTVLCLVSAVLTGCGSFRPPVTSDRQSDGAAATKSPSRGGAYYKDDGPGDNPPDLAAIAEPIPRIETLHRFANNPYNVFGVAYSPQKTFATYKQRGLGSWYGRKFHGQKTSSGEIYDMYGMTAAHPTLPIPSYARVTNVGNGRSVIVRVNDRGPFHPGRIVDLSYTAAWKLGYVSAGSTPVEVELLTPEHIAALPRGNRIGPAPVAVNVAMSPPMTTTTVTPLSRTDLPVEQPAVPERRIEQVAYAPAVPAVPVMVPTAAPQALPVEVQASGVFLQLAAFSGRDNAESFRARIVRELGSLGESIHILQKDGLFRLHAGPYRDRNEAGSMAERLRAELQMNPIIVVR